MQCPKCKSDNPSEALFCMKCGIRLERKCPNCGTEYPNEAVFCMKCGTKLTDTIASTSTATSIPKLEDMQKQLQKRIPQSLADKLFAGAKQMQGEYRLVTAVFADMSGSSVMARDMPLEQYVNVMDECLKMMVDIISIRYEGSINRFIGDCVLAFFGAPITHENDAERAILASLDIRNSVSELNLNVSIGINTGMTYFGEMGNDLMYSERSAWGPDVDFAKRLQESAEPGQIVVGTSTYRLTKRAFDFDNPIDIEIKGTDRLQTAYPALHVSEHPEKLRGIEGLRARMIGREREFSDLKDAVDSLLSGKGSIVSVVGEAGIGKSRLVSEIKEYLKEKYEGGGMKDEKSELHPSAFIPHPYLEGRCMSIGQSVSYWPFLDMLKAYLNLSDTDSEFEVARKLKESMTALFPIRADDVLPFLGNLLSVRLGDNLDDKLKYFTPEQIRHQTLMRLKDVFIAIARQKPLLLILEDLHWADDLSLDLISNMMDELAINPLMLLCIYRPEKEHRCWQIGDLASRKCLDRYTDISLKKLTAHQSRELVESLLEIDNLPESTKIMILKKSEGNPFFIEEVIRYLIDRDIIYHEDDKWIARRKIEDIDVPDTIQSVLLSRVDRLEAETRYVLQCASVIGRLFRYRLLDHISQHERDLEKRLSELEERELILEERTVPEMEYAFKHALTQEATYQGILERKRKEFHLQVAQGIEMLYRERLEDYYEELAHHYSMSNNFEKAGEYLLKAGEKAKRNYANESAVAHFHKVLELLGGQGIDRKDWKLEALRGLGEIYLGIGKPVEAEKAFEEAIVLAKEMGLSPHQLVRLYFWVSEALWWQSRFDETIRYGEMGLDILGDDTECLEAALMNHRIDIGNWSKGNMDKCMEYTHKNMSFIKKLPYSEELRAVYFHIIQIVAYHDRDSESALNWVKELETRAEEHHDLRGIASAWGRQGGILLYKGDLKSLSSYPRSIEMFERIGDDKGASVCHAAMGRHLLSAGDIEESEKHAQLFLTMSKRVGNPRDIAWAYELLGTIAMCQRRWEEAIRYYQMHLEGRQAIGNPDNVGLAHLNLDIAYLQKGDYPKALQCFEETANWAIEIRHERTLVAALWGLEATHRALEMNKDGASVPVRFVEFCQVFKDLHADALETFSLRQWYLESAEPSKEFSHLAFADNFETQTVDPLWQWRDEFEDCSYRIVGADPCVCPNGLEICAANGRDLDGLNLSAPRLMREITGDFAVEVCVSPSYSEDEDKPHQGGLLVWKDKDNFLRFEVGTYGQGEIRLHGYVGGKLAVAGRGLLPSDNEETYLRLERSGDEFTSYCSIDGENWFTCGKMALTMKDPIQVGIHAVGMIDRTIYCGKFKKGTATLFRNFRLWKKEK